RAAGSSVRPENPHYARSTPLLQRNNGLDLAGNDAAVVADRGFAPARQLDSLRVVEESQLLENCDRRRMQAARVAVGDFYRDSPAPAAHADRLDAFGTDLGNPVATTGMHQDG